MLPPIWNRFPLFWNIFLPGKSSCHFLFFPLKLHLIVFQLKWKAIILAGRDIAKVFSEILPEHQTHTVTTTDAPPELWELAEILPDASVQNMQLHFGWGCRTFQTASHVHVIPLWGLWTPSQVVDEWLASQSDHYHHMCFHRFGKVGWNPTWCKCANHPTTLWLRL